MQSAWYPSRIGLILLALGLLVGSTGWSAEPLPAWLQAKLPSVQKQLGKGTPLRITQWLFNGKKTFLLPSSCCDIPERLYDESGKQICVMGGGFANHIEKECQSFKKTAKFLKVVWEAPSE